MLLLLTVCFFSSTKTANAQLWDVPPFPPVKFAPAPDGLTATIGQESLHISVCGASVIHFVATPESPDKAERISRGCFEPKESCPGAKFEISQTTDAAVLTTDKVKVELSLKWGNVQYSTAGGEGPPARAKLDSPHV